MDLNFPNLQAIYNKQIDLLLSSTGLTTLCQFNYGVTNLDICPNCIYDVNLKKSSGKYKSGGPIPFVLGKICPYCNGSGSYGVVKFDTGYLAVIWDYKKWINPPPAIDNPDGYIQTICSKEYLPQIRQCKDLTVFYYTTNANPVFQLYGEPNPAGLGDNRYLFCMWKKIGVSNAAKPSITPTKSRTPTRTCTPTVGVSATPTNTITPTIGVSATPTNTPTLTRTPTVTSSATATPTVGVSATPTNTPTATSTVTSSVTATPTVGVSATPTNTPTITNSITPTPICYSNEIQLDLNSCIVCESNILELNLNSCIVCESNILELNLNSCIYESNSL